MVSARTLSDPPTLFPFSSLMPYTGPRLSESGKIVSSREEYTCRTIRYRDGDLDPGTEEEGYNNKLPKIPDFWVRRCTNAVSLGYVIGLAGARGCSAGR
jgi:hypothetical protein